MGLYGSQGSCVLLARETELSKETGVERERERESERERHAWSRHIAISASRSSGRFRQLVLQTYETTNRPALRPLQHMIGVTAMMEFEELRSLVTCVSVMSLDNGVRGEG